MGHAIRFSLVVMAAACATAREAELPTPAEVDRAVAVAFGDPATEMDFTERTVLLRCGYEDGNPMATALPSLVHWQRTAPEAPLEVGEWSLRLFPPGRHPEGMVALCDIEIDGGKGWEGIYLSLCAAPLGSPARARVRSLEAEAAELPTAAEVDEAVAKAFGPPDGEIDNYLDFTGVSMCMRLDKMNGKPMVAALPSLFRWQERGRETPLRVRDWEIRLLPGRYPERTVLLYEASCDAGMGSDGFNLCVYATPLTPAARARLELR